ncbi:MAG: MFS transporter [Syntrophomonadaceae bacterium]|nr:MFS transporter [Syntrophomonadaceae bacterium]
MVDRFPKRKVLIFTQTSLAVLAVVLANLTYFEIVEYWHVLVLALLLGIVNTLDMPTRQSFFVELVGREDLMNAIALNSSIFNFARIVGPAVAGLLIGLVGIATCFYLNALSFLAVIASLWMINVPLQLAVTEKAGSFKNIFLDIREGLLYIGEKEIIMQPLLLLAFISTFVMNYNVLIPVFAQQNLAQNATGYGFLMTSMGIGSFIGALIIATRSKAGPSLKYLLGGAFGLSLFMAILGLEKGYVLACITLFLMGLCSIVFTALVNSTIQLNSAESMRGRVMSVYSLVFGGVTPIGSLYAGHIAEYAGAPGCMIISGIIGIVATSYTIFIFRKNRSSVNMPA